MATARTSPRRLAQPAASHAPEATFAPPRPPLIPRPAPPEATCRPKARRAIRAASRAHLALTDRCPPTPTPPASRVQRAATLPSLDRPSALCTICHGLTPCPVSLLRPSNCSADESMHPRVSSLPAAQPGAFVTRTVLSALGRSGHRVPRVPTRRHPAPHRATSAALARRARSRRLSAQRMRARAALAIPAPLRRAAARSYVRLARRGHSSRTKMGQSVSPARVRVTANEAQSLRCHAPQAPMQTCRSM